MTAGGFWNRFLIPGALWLLLLFLVPLVFVLALSFGYVDDLGRAVYASDLENYADAFNPTYLPILLRDDRRGLHDLLARSVVQYAERKRPPRPLRRAG